MKLKYKLWFEFPNKYNGTFNILIYDNILKYDNC